MDDYKLPAAYGKSRLVLLPVNPYLIHAYWEVAPEDFEKAKGEAGEAQEVLRFYKMDTDCFDVEIDLKARNWYVHLWSAEESYFADLALKRKDGTLVRLVRSQVVYMPRTHPAIAIDHRFTKVESTERPPEIVPPPPPPSQSPSLSPSPPSQSPSPPPSLSPPRPPSLSPPAEHNRPPVVVAWRLNELVDRSPISKPADTEETLIEELENVYVYHQWPDEPSEPDVAPATSTSDAPTGSHDVDLAAMAEKNLAAGLSSASLHKGRPDGAPDSRK